MEKRGKHIPWKEVGRDVLIALGLVGIGVITATALNYRTAPMTFAALTGKEVPCPPGVSESSFSRPFDLIAVPGGGFKDDTGEPGQLQKERDNAAALLLNAGYGSPGVQVVFLDDLPNGVEINGNPEFLVKRVESLSRGVNHIAPGRLHTIDDSVNTATNMKDLEEFIYGTKWNVLVVSHKDHLLRLAVDGGVNDICPAYISVEEVTSMYDPDQAAKLERRGRNKRQTKEYLALISRFPDPHGKLSTLWKSVFPR